MLTEVEELFRVVLPNWPERWAKRKGRSSVLSKNWSAKKFVHCARTGSSRFAIAFGHINASLIPVPATSHETTLRK